MKALAIAATGMNAQQTNLEVIANNIANVSTTGFKASKAEFTDLLYQKERAAGAPVQMGLEPPPEGIHIGLGVRTAGVRNLHRQGPLTQTSNQFDVALSGRGWFQVTGPNGDNLFTRAGSFNKNVDGQLVTMDGYPVQPAIVVPQNATGVTINENGEVFAKIDGQVAPDNIGQLALATFANDVGLEPIGNNFFRETQGSGAPVFGVAGDLGFGTVKQGYLESSNVDPIKELTGLITAQRAYEMNSKVIQAGDEMAGVVSKGIR